MPKTSRSGKYIKNSRTTLIRGIRLSAIRINPCNRVFMKINTINKEHLKSLESKDSSDKLNSMKLRVQRGMIHI